MSEKTLFRERADTAANLNSSNKIIPARQRVVELDTLQSKIGDGVTSYVNLPYIGVGPQGPAFLEVNGISGVTDVTFNGATVTDNGNGAVTVNITGSGGGGAWVTLFDGALSGLSQVAVTGIDQYQEVRVDIDNATASAGVWGELSADSGATWKAASGDYRRTYFYSTSKGNEVSASGMEISSTGNSGINFSGLLSLHNLATFRTRMKSDIRGFGGDAIMDMFHSSNSELNNGFRIVCRGGAFSAGRAIIMGT